MNVIWERIEWEVDKIIVNINDKEERKKYCKDDEREKNERIKRKNIIERRARK